MQCLLRNQTKTCNVHVYVQCHVAICTHNSQSTARMSAALSGFSPTATNTITKVKNPACGTPAAPILARVAVMLFNSVCNKDTLVLCL